MFPELTCLESFDWQVRSGGEENSWLTRMVNTYGKQRGIRKLAIDVYYFEPDLVSNSLTELHLMMEAMDFNDVDDIEEKLKCIQNGQIRKLCLSDTPFRHGKKDICINKFVKMLAGFQIENAVFDRFSLKEDDDDESDDNIKAFSITSLYLEDNVKLKYQFLRRLPNLRFLTIYMNYSTYKNVKFFKKGDAYANKFRKYFIKAVECQSGVPNPVERFQDFNIWDVLPNLKILSVSVSNGNQILDIQYVREYGNRPIVGNNMILGREDADEVSAESSESESDLESG